MVDVTDRARKRTESIDADCPHPYEAFYAEDVPELLAEVERLRKHIDDITPSGTREPGEQW